MTTAKEHRAGRALGAVAFTCAPTHTRAQKPKFDGLRVIRIAITVIAAMIAAGLIK